MSLDREKNLATHLNNELSSTKNKNKDLEDKANAQELELSTLRQEMKNRFILIEIEQLVHRGEEGVYLHEEELSKHDNKVIAHIKEVAEIYNQPLVSQLIELSALKLRQPTKWRILKMKAKIMTLRNLIMKMLVKMEKKMVIKMMMMIMMEMT